MRNVRSHAEAAKEPSLRRRRDDVDESLPGFGVLGDEGRQVERHVLDRIARREIPGRLLGHRRIGLREVLSADQAVLVRDSEEIEERSHHRPLPLEVIAYEGARGDRVSHGRQLREVLGAPVRRQRQHAPGTKLHVRGNGGDRLHLLVRRVFVVPEEARCVDAPLERHPPPELRRPEIRQIPIHSIILARTSVIALESEGLPDRLFTPRFFVMCGFSFTVFLSAFQLLPTAPFHILALGGGTPAAGLFLGFLTYASAFSAPVTGTLGDRFGPLRILIVASVAITGFCVAYGLIPGYHVIVGLVLIHGVFWSGLLTGSAAYMTNILPESRRAEGIAYWGLSTIAAIAVAPSIGFWMFHFGWRVLCLEAAALHIVMAIIAWRLPPQAIAATSGAHPKRRLGQWRALIRSLSPLLSSLGSAANTIL